MKFLKFIAKKVVELVGILVFTLIIFGMAMAIWFGLNEENLRTFNRGADKVNLVFDRLVCKLS